MEPPPYDAVIVGAGSAGLPAAIAAAERGARVYLLEWADQVGGTLRIGRGHISGAGTRRQAERGIADSAEQHFADAMRASGGTADAALLKAAVEAQGPFIDWLMQHGFEMDEAAPRMTPGRGGHSTPRVYWGREGARSILNVLERLLDAHVAAGRIALHLGTEAAEPIIEHGAVVGVRARDGRRFLGRSVVLTAGGYAANSALFARIHGGATLWSGAYPYAMGAGLELGLKAGGVLVHAERFRANFGGVLDPTLAEPRWRSPGGLSPELRPPWEIVVNREGRRFYAEDAGGAVERAALLQAQTGSRAWVVYDEAIRRAAPRLFSAFPAEAEARLYGAGDAIVQAGGLAELAERAGVDAAGLASAVADYNRAVDGAEDPFGRRFLPRRIEAAPFYALPIAAYTVRSAAGLEVDAELRVLDAAGQPIPGLFAAGEVLGAAFSGEEGEGGMSLAPALALGRRLGQRLPVA